MAIRKRVVESVKLELRPTPFIKSAKMDAFYEGAEDDLNTLSAYLAANFKEIWEHGTHAPAYAYAKFLKMHRISYNEWSYALYKCGLWEMGESIRTNIPRYEKDHPAHNPSNTVTIPTYAPVEQGDDADSRIEVSVIPYNPYDENCIYEWDKHFATPLAGRNAIRYVDNYYQSTVDEFYAARGRRRKLKDGRYFAPIIVLSDGIEIKDRKYEEKNRQYEIAEACRVRTPEEADTRKTPIFVPAHKGELPAYIRDRLNPPKALPIKKRPK